MPKIASSRQCSVAELIREAIHAQYLVDTDDRLAAVEDLLAMDVPMEKWGELKKMIEERHGAALS